VLVLVNGQPTATDEDIDKYEIAQLSLERSFETANVKVSWLRHLLYKQDTVI